MEALDREIVHTITSDTYDIQISFLTIRRLQPWRPFCFVRVLDDHSLSLVRPFTTLLFLLK